VVIDRVCAYLLNGPLPLSQKTYRHHCLASLPYDRPRAAHTRQPSRSPGPSNPPREVNHHPRAALATMTGQRVRAKLPRVDLREVTLSLTQSQGTVRTVVDEPPLIKNLLAHCLRELSLRKDRTQPKAPCLCGLYLIDLISEQVVSHENRQAPGVVADEAVQPVGGAKADKMGA
jgi:hypothetical protein